MNSSLFSSATFGLQRDQPGDGAGLHAHIPQDAHGNVVPFLENGLEKVRRLDDFPAGVDRRIPGQFEDGLGGRRNLHPPARDLFGAAEVFLQGMDDLVRAQIQFPGEIREETGFDLHDREENVLHPQVIVLPLLRFFDRRGQDLMGLFRKVVFIIA